MRARTGWILAALIIATSACTAILGDFDVNQGDGGPTQGTDAAGDAPNGGDAIAPGDAGCPGSQTSCSTGCVDLQKSSANCGKCGHDCNTATCTAGSCGAYVITKQPTTGAVTKLATDGTHVVWADTGIAAILEIPATGGAAIKLATSSAANGATGSELALASNGTVAFNYVGNSNPPSVGLAKVDVADSGAPVFNGIVQINAVSMSPSGAHLVYVNSHGTASDLIDCAVTLARDAGPCGPGVSGGRFADETAVDDGFVFLDLTQANINPSQSGLYLGATAVDNVDIFTTAVASSMATDGTWAYWTQTTTFPDGGPAFMLQRTLEATPGAAQTPVAAMASSAFATDGNNVYYWTGSAIVSRPVAGGADTTLAPAAAFVEIAVGGKLVVWTDGAAINGIVVP